MRVAIVNGPGNDFPEACKSDPGTLFTFQLKCGKEARCTIRRCGRHSTMMCTFEGQLTDQLEIDGMHYGPNDPVRCTSYLYGLAGSAGTILGYLDIEMHPLT